MKDLYKNIKKFVYKLYAGKLSGHALTRAKQLVNIIYGILRSKKSSLSGIAESIAGHKKFASKIRQIKRWLMSRHNGYETHFMPFMEVLLVALAERGELVFAIDGSILGEGCIALMVSVVFEGRSLPVCWIVRKGKKGHFPEQMHVDLLKVLHKVVPGGAAVAILGDGEFDGCDLQKTCADFKWRYVFRATKNVWLFKEGEGFRLQDMDLGTQPYLFFEDVDYTTKRYGKVNVGYFHQKDCKDPLFLVTNFELIEEAFAYYKKRFLIETLFSDMKSRGFNLQKSKLDEPQRITDLLIPLSLAYIFTIQQGIQAYLQKMVAFLTFEDKNEASLFTIGRRMIVFCEENLMKVKYSLSVFLSSKICVPL